MVKLNVDDEILVHVRAYPSTYILLILHFGSNETTIYEAVKGPILTDDINHYDDVIMTTLASQITSLTVFYSIVYSDVDEREHQSSASLAFVREIHRDRWIPRTKGQ